MKTSKPKVIHLFEDERIIAVIPERCSGPGWGNSPVWVYIAAQAGGLREECIQPSERTSEMNTLFYPGEAMVAALMNAVPQRKIKSK